MGGRSSETKTNTQSNYNDNRQVFDAGGGIAGSGNWWDQSTTWTSNTADNRTNTNSGNTTWQQSTADNRTNSNSGNTTWNSDSSNRSTTTNNVTDGGAIAAMQEIAGGQATLAERIARISADSSSSSTAAAIKAQEGAMSTVKASTDRAFDFASSSNAQAFKSNSDALGLVSEKFSDIARLTSTLLTSAQKQSDSAAGSVAAAYSSAASQANGNKTLTIAALAAVGLVAGLVVLKKV